MRQAYYTATGRQGGTNLAEMTITENELPLFLKHLFFFHRIYALFDQTFEFDTVLTQKRYIDVLEDFSDRDLHKENLEEKFAVLCEEHNGEVTYATFVNHLATSIFATTSAFPTEICAALIEKNTGEMKEHEAHILKHGSSSLRSIDTDTESLLLNVSWYSVRGEGCDTWLHVIESLGNNYFRSILSKCVCVQFCVVLLSFSTYIYYEFIYLHTCSIIYANWLYVYMMHAYTLRCVLYAVYVYTYV